MKRTNLLVVSAILVAVSFLVMSMSNGVMQDWPIPAKYKSMKNTKAGVKDTEGVGKALYKQHCASCHGAKADGQGAKASTLTKEMRDWSKKEVQAQTDGELYCKSFVGKGEMPNYEKKITAEGDRWLLVNYIRTFKK